jgi:demethylmenaquinone methyltransferase/2-methoxy-6-polyprenyl-1,4-benzoquinol methylase
VFVRVERPHLHILEEYMHHAERKPQTESEIAVFFDRVADQQLMVDFPEDERVKLEYFFSLWRLQPGERVLEPGSGSGRLTACLARAVGPQGEVYACDLSPKMLAIARNRRLPPQAHVVCESVMNIQRPEDWFDVVVCLNVFPHFADPSPVLREFARLLKPGGRLWVNHFEGSESLNRFHRDAAPEVSDHALPPGTEMRRLVEGAGFRIERFGDCAEHYILGAVLK